LQLDEFTKVLALAGFGEDEARQIFSEVDTDNGGSVGMEEFESEPSGLLLAAFFEKPKLRK
jgi:Ca2+-binding EF-hand superfamily protein